MSSTPNHPVQPHAPAIDVPLDIEAVYVNLVRIAHSPSELVFDFAHLLPGISPARVRTRVVMSPLGAKLLYRALGENLARFEASYGEITIPGVASLADTLFRTPPPIPPDHPPEE